MKIKYLGTSACEGIPALFCDCEICRNARKEKGKEIRTRSQALINDDLLIDFGPDTYLHVLRYDIDLFKIENLLITHSHFDHFIEQEFENRIFSFAHFDGHEILNVYGGEDVINRTNKMIESLNMKNRLKSCLIKPYQKNNIGKYIVYPLPARHDPKSSPFIYLIIDEKGKSILYANDTGMLFEEVFDFLSSLKLRLDLLSIDSTNTMATTTCTPHMNLMENRIVINRLKELKIIDDKTTIVLNHFSHHSNISYKDLSKLVEKDNFIVSYDGLEIEL